MSMKEWAKREVEIVCKKENPDRKEGEFDYSCSCYESALKAYNSLLEDSHSGMSMSLTKNILVRLIEGKPLTPIEDTEDMWNYIGHLKEGVATFQCKRMSSFFKTIKSDGTIKYRDNNRVVCINIHNNSTSYFGLIANIVEEKYPITMPYYPTEVIKVYYEDFLVDEKNGDFDTVGVFYMVLPSGEKKNINQHYKATEDGYERISAEEYYDRLDKKIK